VINDVSQIKQNIDRWNDHLYRTRAAWRAILEQSSVIYSVL